MPANLKRPRSRAMLAGAVMVVLGGSAARAAVVAFPQDLSGFNTAAGNPPVAVDFDSIASDTDITGQNIAGATFNATGSALIVFAGADTNTSGAYSGLIDASTNKLLPTSGANVLTPGGPSLTPGPDATVESDGVEIIFDNAVTSFGFDHLSQSADGFGFTNVQVFNESDVSLFSGPVPISNAGGAGGGAAGAADFWGIVSDAADIKRIVITEGDADASFPDNNIGFDTLRFATEVAPPPPPPPPPAGIPLPAAAYTAPLMFAAFAWAKRKFQF